MRKVVHKNVVLKITILFFLPYLFAIRAVEPVASSCAPLPSSAAAWWRSDTSIFDEIGGFDMEQRGTLAFAPGKIGQSWLFNGIDTEIITDASPRHSLLSADDQGITFEAWIAPESDPGPQTFLTWQTFDSRDMIEFYLQSPASPGGLWTLGVSGGTTTLTLLAKMTAGEFQHLAFTYFPVTGAIAFFLNGTWLAGDKFAVPGNNYLPRIKFGGRDGARFNGRLDEIILHSRILKADEIMASAAADEGHCWAPHPPEFVTQQQPRSTASVGELFILEADVKGAAPLSYQWRHEGTNFPGGLAYQYIITNAFPSDAGSYDLMVTNNYGSITSRVSRVSISLLANGSFDESSTQGWIIQDLSQPLLPVKVASAGRGVPFPLFRSAPAEGAYSLTHGFAGSSPGVIRLIQDFLEISPGLQLSFLYRAGWNLQDYGPATLPRTFQFNIEPYGGGGPLSSKTLLIAAPQTKNSGTPWQKETVSLDPWIGQRIRIVFQWTVPEANTGPAMFELDAVKLFNFSGPALKLDYLPASGSVRLHFSGDAPSYTIWTSGDLLDWHPSAEPVKKNNGEFEFTSLVQPLVPYFYKLSTP
jgi:hypothetical protein